MTKTVSFIRYWLLPFGWMGLIFVGSADAKSYQHSSRIIEPLLRWLFPGMSEEHIHLLHHIARKCAHLTEYAVLALLLWRAVRKPVRKDSRPWSWRQAGIAIAIVFLYAASDEFHQIFVPTRTPLVSDVFIDTSGAVMVMVALWAIGSLFGWWGKTEGSS